VLEPISRAPRARLCPVAQAAEPVFGAFERPERCALVWCFGRQGAACQPIESGRELRIDEELAYPLHCTAAARLTGTAVGGVVAPSCGRTGSVRIMSRHDAMASSSGGQRATFRNACADSKQVSVTC
jgi:hypothetical protein